MDWEDMVLVGRVARAHGLRGRVAVEPVTDFVEARFAVGARVWALVDGRPVELTITEARLAGSRPVVGFSGRTRREDAEALAGSDLRVPEALLHALPEGRYYHHQLEGCAVVTTAGEAVGVVARVDGAGDGCLVVQGARGEVLVPLVPDICVEVDVAARCIRIAPPEGLLDLNAPGGAAERSGGAGG